MNNNQNLVPNSVSPNSVPVDGVSPNKAVPNDVAANCASPAGKTVLSVELKGISKTFVTVRANHNINLLLRAGHIKALLGENGAGKSTLMSILSGSLMPDSGEILLNGEPVVFRSPRDAHNAGIGMVYQHFMLVDCMSVTENVLLGNSSTLLIKPKEMRARVAELSARYGLEVSPDALIRDLSMGERQRVEILKLLCRESNLLIFDEPTAVLTPKEGEQLFAAMRRMTEQGKSIVFISHKLPEVLAIADEVAILRRGEIVDEFARDQVPNEAELARRMLGYNLDRLASSAIGLVDMPGDTSTETPGGILSAISGDQLTDSPKSELNEQNEPREQSGQDCKKSEPKAITAIPSSRHAPLPVKVKTQLPAKAQSILPAKVHTAVSTTAAVNEEFVLEFKGVSCPGLRDINFTLEKGQILAVLGVAGNGQKELVELICGARKASSGLVKVLGEPVEDFLKKRLKTNGLVYIPEDRKGLASCPEMNLVANFLLTTRKLFSHKGLLEKGRSVNATEALIHDYSVYPPIINARGRELSGGNLQKLIVGRELIRNPACIVAENPTQGLDVAAAEEVWEKLRSAQDNSAILLVTGDLNEALVLADHMAVMYRGRIVDIFSVRDTEKIKNIGLMMAGSA